MVKWMGTSKQRQGPNVNIRMTKAGEVWARPMARSKDLRASCEGWGFHASGMHFLLHIPTRACMNRRTAASLRILAEWGLPDDQVLSPCSWIFFHTRFAANLDWGDCFQQVRMIRTNTFIVYKKDHTKMFTGTCKKKKERKKKCYNSIAGQEVKCLFQNEDYCTRKRMSDYFLFTSGHLWTWQENIPPTSRNF